MVLLEFQKQLRQELLSKPPKWSRELLDMRRKQHNCARSKAYAEAQKLKKLCDKIEENERKEMESGQAINFAKKEAKYRLHQQAELHALLKRIECRRKEHIKQRNLGRSCARHYLLTPARINRRDWLNLPVESRLSIRAGGSVCFFRHIFSSSFPSPISFPFS